MIRWWGFVLLLLIAPLGAATVTITFDLNRLGAAVVGLLWGGAAAAIVIADYRRTARRREAERRDRRETLN